MLIFPTIVYRVPGVHSGPGFTYDYAGALDQAAYDKLKADGWHGTLPEAVSPPVVAPAASEDVPADDAPPTRAEIEAKATELGIKFDGRTTDTLLLKRINDVLNGG